MSTICSLINSTSKLCRIDERPAKGTFPTLSLEPFDSLVDLLATFRARNFQRQIVEKHSLVGLVHFCRAVKFKTVRDFAYGIQRTNRGHRDALPTGAILTISSGARVESSPSVSS